MRSFCCRCKKAKASAQEDPELAAQEERLDYHDDDQRLRREEFEENLHLMGLQMEKDEGVSSVVLIEVDIFIYSAVKRFFFNLIKHD